MAVDAGVPFSPRHPTPPSGVHAPSVYCRGGGALHGTMAHPNPQAHLEASQQDAAASNDWLKRIAAIMRAHQLPASAAQLKVLIPRVVEGQHELNPYQVCVLENRTAYLTGTAPTAQYCCPPRPPESRWLLHADRNALICSAYDFQVTVIARRDLVGGSSGVGMSFLFSLW